MFENGDVNGDVVEQLQRAARLVSVAQGGLMAVIVAVARESPEAEFVSMEISAALAWTRQRAGTQLELAHTLVERLPAVQAALFRGDLDLERARVFADSVAALDVPTARRVCELALPDAPRLTTGQLRARLAKLVIEADPEAAATRHRQRVRERRLVLEPQPDSTASLSLHDLPAARAVAAANRVHDMALALRRAGDPRRMDQLRADTALNLLLGTAPTNTFAASANTYASASAETTASASTADAATATAGATATCARCAGAADADADGAAGGVGANGSVEIVASLATLVGLADFPGQLNGFGPVIADIARQVAQRQRRGRWTFTIYDNASGQFFTGLTRRRPSEDLARHVRQRDRTCRFPGCRVPATRTDIDHTVRVSHGGLTHHGNLGCLCRFHHRGRHEGGWRLTQPAPGHFVWRSPLGKAYRVSPPGAEPLRR